eukprot:13163505-Alexandrium_andersonii.AAC.1
MDVLAAPFDAPGRADGADASLPALLHLESWESRCDGCGAPDDPPGEDDSDDLGGLPEGSARHKLFECPGLA